MIKKGILNKILVIFFQGLLLITLPLIAKYLGNKEYGIWSIIYGMMQMMVPLVILQLNGAFTRFMAGTSSKESIRNIFISISVLISIISLFVYGLVYLFSINISYLMFADIAYENFVYVAISWTIVRVFIMFNKNYFRTFGIFHIDTKLSISQHLSVILSIFIVAFNDMGLFDFFLLILSMEICILLISYILIFHELGVNKYRFQIPKKYFKYALPLIPTMLLSWVINYSDQIMIVHFLSLEENARYSLHYTYSRIPHWIIVTPLHYVLLPYLSQYSYSGSNVIKINRYIKDSVNISFLLMSFLIVFLLFFGAEILQYLGNQKILQDSLYLILIIGLSVFATAFYQIIYHILSLKNKTASLIYIFGIGAILNIVFNYIFINELGILGAAISTIISFILVSYFTWRATGSSFNDVFSMPILVFLSILVLIATLIKSFFPHNYFMLVFFLFLMIPIYLLFIKKYHYNYFDFILQKLKVDV
jgi:O-antigen/teichoic acid export membrane protein